MYTTAMSQFFQIHPETPQLRLIRQAAEILRAGGVIAYPTDSAYALGCLIGDKKRLSAFARFVDWTKSITSPWCAEISLNWPPMLRSTMFNTVY